MAKSIKKRSRGRPGRMDKLMFDMQMSVIKAQEDLTEAYPTAVKFLIEVLDNKDASVTNKLQAAKTIKEAVEASLEEMENEEEEGQSTPEAPVEAARLEIG